MRPVHLTQTRQEQNASTNSIKEMRDVAILCTAKTKIALSRFKGVKGFNGRFE